MAFCNLPIKCISEELCKDCAYMELNINQAQFWADDGTVHNVNEIYCVNFKKCTAMLNHLNVSKKDEENEL